MSICSAKTNKTLDDFFKLAVLDIQIGNLYYRNDRGKYIF